MRTVASGSSTPTAASRGKFVPCVSVLHLQGSLRTPLSLDLRRRIEGLLARGHRSILLDLADVTDLDACGVGELVRVYALTEAAKGELWIENTTRKARKLLDLAGLFALLSAPSSLAHERCSV
jgi:anti-sigma B factor antagonist